MSDFFVSIDPGKNQSWVAYWRDRRLVSVAPYPHPETLGHVTGYVEFPDRLQPGVPLEDILDVAGVADGWRWLNPSRLERIKPSLWNNSQPKPITHRKVIYELMGPEFKIVADAIGMSREKITVKIAKACENFARDGKVTGYRWDAHNTLDAVGIGLATLGRR